VKLQDRPGLIIAFVGILLWSTAFRWLITPINHPDASTLRTAAVWAQAIVGVAMTVVGYRKDRDVRRRESSHVGQPQYPSREH
jgi:hypothetical protein